jgi:hypothetical protein
MSNNVSRLSISYSPYRKNPGALKHRESSLFTTTFHDQRSATPKIVNIKAIIQVVPSTMALTETHCRLVLLRP